jgi:Flp pilus assembly protein TadG
MSQMRWPFAARMRSTLCDCRGIASLEFAIIATLMVIFVLAGFDLGHAAQQRILLQEAVRAGGQYAMSYPFNSSGTVNTTAITNAISTALPASWTNATIGTPTASCSCWSSSGGTTASATCTCSGSATLQRYMTLSASRPYSGTGYLSAVLGTNSASYVARFQ